MPPVFLRLWLGQWISNLGTQISLFGLGLWLFKADGQLGSFALVAVVVQLSRLAVMRLLVRGLERWPRRRVMVVANAAGACGTLGLAIALAATGGRVAIVHVLPFLVVAAAAEAAQVLSFSTLINKLVPVRSRGEATGLFATADGFAALAAPLLGALLAAWAGLPGVVILDSATCLFALVCVSVGRWPRRALVPLSIAQSSSIVKSASLRDAFRSLLASSRLRPLLMLGAALMLVFAACEVLFPAWTLLLPAGRSRLALALGLSALAYGGGLVCWRYLAAQPNLWLGTFRYGIVMQSLVLIAAVIPGISRQPLLWFAGVAVFNFAVPLVLAAQQNLWQRWVPESQQPQLFSVRYATDWTIRLLAVAAMGPLVDKILAPLLSASSSEALRTEKSIAMALAMLGFLLISMVLSNRQWFSMGVARVAE